ncbi:hypothetical protein K505DRAFT_14657 [Melanomma pulvis-pyrius CBS 109.77]|uniref:Uncharacterized protein n=1 Tax=Melanomma pulvis-pyrius CBS 109.77 TaxID=1314802 RepID=A0A6A6XFK1_9PLEO|nr:hypothetical protein K505DRAFT_14657 [Melanomma pulvis-pyrius CBS 109.77]
MRASKSRSLTCAPPPPRRSPHARRASSNPISFHGRCGTGARTPRLLLTPSLVRIPHLNLMPLDTPPTTLNGPPSAISGRAQSGPRRHTLALPGPPTYQLDWERVRGPTYEESCDPDSSTCASCLRLVCGDGRRARKARRVGRKGKTCVQGQAALLYASIHLSDCNTYYIYWAGLVLVCYSRRPPVVCMLSPRALQTLGCRLSI